VRCLPLQSAALTTNLMVLALLGGTSPIQAAYISTVSQITGMDTALTMTSDLTTLTSTEECGQVSVVPERPSDELPPPPTNPQVFTPQWAQGDLHPQAQSGASVPPRGSGSGDSPSSHYPGLTGQPKLPEDAISCLLDTETTASLPFPLSSGLFRPPRDTV